MNNATLLAFALSLPFTGWGADVPRVDPLGNADFTDSFISVDLGSSHADLRDADQGFEAYHATLGVFSISGYSTRPDKDAGLLLGAGARLRTWFASSQGVDWQAVAPFILLSGGGYIDPVRNFRVSLTGEIGPGVGFSRTEYHGNTDTETFRLVYHAGAHLTGMTRIRSDTDFGLVLGYEYDRMPDVTASGPFVGLIVRWCATGR